MQVEKSKPYPLNEKYIILSDGKIIGTKNKILKPARHPQGYLYIVLGGKSCKVHRLVAITFIPNPNNYEDVNHINGIKDDNRVENLEWCNDSMNIKHAFKIGLKTHLGDNNPRKIIKSFQIPEILNKIKSGMSNVKIASYYGVNHRTISAIKNKKNWKHLQG